MNGNKGKIIRVDKATVIIFSILFSPFLLTGLIVLAKAHDWHGAGLILLYPTLVYCISSPTVELLPQKLVYRALFIRRVANLSGVQEVRIVRERTNRRISPPILEMLSDHGPQPVCRFIIKPFSKAGIVTIMQHIRQYSPDAKFDRVSSDLLAGDFKSVTRQNIGQPN